MASSWFSLYSTIKMMHGPINIRFISSKLILQGFNISSYLWLKTQMCKISVCIKMSDIQYTVRYLRLLRQGPLQSRNKSHIWYTVVSHLIIIWTVLHNFKILSKVSSQMRWHLVRCLLYYSWEAIHPYRKGTLQWDRSPTRPTATLKKPAATSKD